VHECDEVCVCVHSPPLDRRNDGTRRSNAAHVEHLDIGLTGNVRVWVLGFDEAKAEGDLEQVVRLSDENASGVIPVHRVYFTTVDHVILRAKNHWVVAGISDFELEFDASRSAIGDLMTPGYLFEREHVSSVAAVGGMPLVFVTTRADAKIDDSTRAERDVRLGKPCTDNSMVVVHRLGSERVMREEDVLHPMFVGPFRKFCHSDLGLVHCIDVVEDVDRILCGWDVFDECLNQNASRASIKPFVILEVIFGHGFFEILWRAAVECGVSEEIASLCRCSI
jgi:hypothetical protein